ncbi:major facilitator superfamily permease [Lapidilactobacillus concavus DSM 17758]|uniref:Major facilitator superfamily permease n=1 Tax=Lapidilactobacillus concavus DSM 17758 TaxID=1423735 RepID=A0A0R1VSZ2_9LACO|nr:major facilitator superfamily permease [Lapidilactobacillus concavus DSM 17758]
MAPQMIIPFAAYLSSGLNQGQVLGNVMSGLLTSILLSRSLSGLIASVFPWQTVYLVAATMIVILLIVLHFRLPRDPRGHQQLNYFKVLRSLPHLLFSQKYLQGSAINGFALFGISNVLWATLAFYLQAEYHLGTGIAGLMGLLGITGILFAPIIGKLVDTRSPRLTIGLGIFFSAVAFLIFWLAGQWLVGLIIGIILLDLGTQFGQVSNQAIVQSLSCHSGNRNNSVIMFAYFMGGACGTWLATSAWTAFGWAGVCLVAVGFLLVAVLGHLLRPEPTKLH